MQEGRSYDENETEGVVYPGEEETKPEPPKKSVDAVHAWRNLYTYKTYYTTANINTRVLSPSTWGK